MPTDKTTAIAPAKVITDLAAGKIEKWGDLVAAVAPPSAPAQAPTKLPVPRAITDEANEAIAKLPEVFASVVPTERRELVPSEVTSLLNERDALKTIEKLVKERLDDISLTVKNSSTATYEADPDAVDPSSVSLDADGNPIITADGQVVRKVRIGGDDPALDQEVSLEVRKGSVSCSPDKLEELADDADVDFIDRADYLAMTTQVRVFDEAKAILALRKNPDLLRAVREATTQANPTLSVYQRRRA